MKTRKTVKRSTTVRLMRLVEGELARQGISDARAAREAHLPGSVFQSLLRLGKRPTLDRADEIYTGLGISMLIGVTAPGADPERDDTTDQGWHPRRRLIRNAEAAVAATEAGNRRPPRRWHPTTSSTT